MENFLGFVSKNYFKFEGTGGECQKIKFPEFISHRQGLRIKNLICFKAIKNTQKYF